MTDAWDELERLAKAATDGPWQRSGVRRKLGEEDCIGVGPDGFLIAFLPTGKRPHDHAGAFMDAGYIAAANPSAVLALIAAARAKVFGIQLSGDELSVLLEVLEFAGDEIGEPGAAQTLYQKAEALAALNAESQVGIFALGENEPDPPLSGGMKPNNTGEGEG